MTDERYRAGGGGDVSRLLLESTDLDAPPPGAHDRVLAAMGVGAALGASGVAAAATAKKAASVTMLSLVKWAGVGASVALVTVGTATVVAMRTEAPSNTTTAVVTSVAVVVHAAPVLPSLPAAPQLVPPMAEIPGETPVLPSEIATPRAPLRPVESVSPSSLPSIAALPTQTPTDLALEVHSLDGVRHALTASDPRGALRLLDAYSSRFPRGALAPEATVLRVQALVGVGDRAGAEALGQRFIAGNPASPHAQRVKSLLANRFSDQPPAKRTPGSAVNHRGEDQ